MADYKCLCLPDKPIFRSEAEKKVWKALRKRLRPGDVLLHGVHFSDSDGDSEVDLIVLMSEGFATIEVKGGRVWFEDGRWQQSSRDGVVELDLEHQAVAHKHRVGRYLAARWGSGRPRMQHLVALPDMVLGDADPSPGIRRKLVIDKSDLPDAAGRVFDSLKEWMSGQPDMHPGDALVEEAGRLLAGRGDPQARIANRLAAQDDVVSRLTEDQFVILDIAGRLPRVEVNGGPGSGKTWVAVEQLRRWASAGDSVGFVCFSRGLATWVERLVRDWPKAQRDRVWVGTFHSLGHRWGVEIPDDLAADDAEFWEVRFLERMRELAGTSQPVFDALVVDEAQDFAETWWPVLVRGLRNPDNGRLMVFADEHQKVFDRTTGPLAGLVPLQLTTNMRNTKQIARVFGPLVERRQTLVGLEGTEVRFVRCTSDTAIPTADDAAVALLDEGWSPGDVVLLTTHHRHPVHRELAVDRDSYWDSLWDDEDLFYCTVAGFKGLERQAVVLAVDGFRNGDVARRVLYVGLSRARDLLVVCGDPDELRRVGGKELVKRLLGQP